jgi:hypothetical protein
LVDIVIVVDSVSAGIGAPARQAGGGTAARLRAARPAMREKWATGRMLPEVRRAMQLSRGACGPYDSRAACARIAVDLHQACRRGRS